MEKVDNVNDNDAIVNYIKILQKQSAAPKQNINACDKIGESVD